MSASKLVRPAVALYQDLTARREKIKKLAFAEADGAAQRVRDERDDATAALEAATESVRASTSAGPVTAASLALSSYGLAMSSQAIERAEERVAEAEIPVAAARLALGRAARDRLIADRWVERERRATLMELDLAADREASDRAGRG